MKTEFNNQTVLVTGGAGFIGSNLCEALLNKNNKVVCLDNFATGKRENIKEFHKDPNFILIEGDIRKLDDCLTIQSSSKLLKNGNIMKFVHGIFAEFNEKFKEKIIEIKNSENKKYLNSLEDVIVSQDYRFIKDIISPYLSFLKQKCLKNYR